MDRSTPIELIAESYTRDELGQYIPAETSRTVYANVRSVGRSEWFAAGQIGLRPELTFSMFAPDYAGEKIVRYNGVRYAIYRTYIRQDEQIELYTETQTGVTKAAEVDEDADEDDG